MKATWDVCASKIRVVLGSVLTTAFRDVLKDRVRTVAKVLPDDGFATSFDGTNQVPLRGGRSLGSGNCCRPLDLHSLRFATGQAPLHSYRYMLSIPDNELLLFLERLRVAKTFSLHYRAIGLRPPHQRLRLVDASSYTATCCQSLRSEPRRLERG